MQAENQVDLLTRKRIASQNTQEKLEEQMKRLRIKIDQTENQSIQRKDK